MAHEAMLDKDLLSGYYEYILITGGSEPISYLIYYLLAQFTSFNMANALLNFTLLIIMHKYFLKYNITIYIWFPFFITNYYFLVLGYVALRLKLAIIFYFYFLLYKNNILFILLSFLSHFQIILLLISKFFYKYSGLKLFNLKNILILLIIIIYFQSTLIDKFNFYYLINLENKNFPFKTIVFFIASIFIIKDIKKIIIIFILMFSSALILGEGRINILYFLVVLDGFITNNKNMLLSKFIFASIIIYLSIKGIDFGINWAQGIDYLTE
jgi:hypothetical protein